MKRSGGFEIEIRQDRNTKALNVLMSQWPERAERIQRLLPYLAAHYVLQKILEKIPNQDDWAAYRSALEVVAVIGAKRGLSAYALRASQHRRKVRQVDVPRTILHVRPNRRLRRVKPEVTILEKYSPWTVQTLPFTPKRSDAIVISRKVGKKEADKVTKARLKDRPAWRKALDHVGRREIHKDKRLEIPKKVKALPDVAFEALRLEFGTGGMKAIPHWKPAIRELISTGIRSILREDPKIKRALTRLSFTGWRRWPPRSRHKMRISDLKSFASFQKKLGFRAKI